MATNNSVNNRLFDSDFCLVDQADTSKLVAFELSGISAATTRTLTIPNASGTLVLNDNTATLTNKTIAGGSNTISALTGSMMTNNTVGDAQLRQSAGLSVVGRSASTTGDVADITAASNNTVLRRSGTSIGFGTVTGSMMTNNTVTATQLLQIAGLSVLGRSANTTGNMAAITGTDGQVLRVSGTTLGFGTVATAGIADDAITFAKMQNISTSRLLGRSTASSGDIEQITIGSGLTLSGGQLSASGGLASNVQVATKQDTFTCSVTSYTDVTDLSVTITPSSASSRILVQASLSVGTDAGNHIAVQLLRSPSQELARATAASNRSLSTTGTAVGADVMSNVTCNAIDSPATTSATTYKVQIKRVGSSGSVYIGRSSTDTDADTFLRGGCTLIVQEIGA